MKILMAALLLLLADAYKCYTVPAPQIHYQVYFRGRIIYDIWMDGIKQICHGEIRNIAKRDMQVDSIIYTIGSPVKYQGIHSFK